MTIGDTVRKAKRRGQPASATLGVVTELVTLNGRLWARVAAGAARKVSSLWPVRQLEVVNV
jgi:hypothetical protein